MGWPSLTKAVFAFLSHGLPAVRPRQKHDLPQPPPRDKIRLIRPSQSPLEEGTDKSPGTPNPHKPAVRSQGYDKIAQRCIDKPKENMSIFV
jgi:hypothetical protein